MIPISSSFKAHLAQPYQTLCTLWLVNLTNGTTLGFTDLDRDIIYNAVLFRAQTGYTRTDIASSDDLSVDNMEVDGVINAPSITENDLRIGIWDYADIQVSMVIWSEFFTNLGLTSIARSGSTAGVTTINAHGLSTGDQVEMGGADQPEYNGRKLIGVTGSHTFTYPVTGTPTTPATGPIYYQVNSGEMILRCGKLGEVTLEIGRALV